MWIPFYVICSACGYRNKADYVVRESFRLVLRGQFTACRNRKCKKHFVNIEVPLRKGVCDEMKQMANDGIALPAHISVYEVSGEPALTHNACARGVT
jgi:hypothetical protein